jgi:hypothetical protein
MKIRIYFRVYSEDQFGMIGAAQKRAQRTRRGRLAKRATAQFDAVNEPQKKGGILAALRRSPLVGTDLNLTRSREPAVRSIYDAKPAPRYECSQAL